MKKLIRKVVKIVKHNNSIKMSLQHNCSILSGILTIILCLTIAIICSVFLAESANQQNELVCLEPNLNNTVYSSNCILTSKFNVMGMHVPQDIIIVIKSCPINGYLGSPYLNQTDEWVGEKKCWYYSEDVNCLYIGSGIYYQDFFTVMFVEPNMVKERDEYYECIAKDKHYKIIINFLIIWLVLAIFSIITTTALVISWGIKGQQAQYYRI